MFARKMILHVVLDVPLLSNLSDIYHYRWSVAGAPLPESGQRVIVPFGGQTLIGLVLEVGGTSELAPEKIRDAIAVLDDVLPLPPDWFQLVRFAARYYQRSLGEVALPALPLLLRQASAYTRQIEPKYADARASPQNPQHAPSSRSIKLILKKLENDVSARLSQPPTGALPPPPLTSEQAHAVDEIRNMLLPGHGFGATLLHGVTASGKTEVYLHAVAEVLGRGRQVLLLVPEINLTPQLEQVFRARFPKAVIATMHSAMNDRERAVQWLAAHQGHADILLGTRMAVLTPLQRLGLIVVDEEHDPSFKQQEGLRYSARDLAVVRAQQLRIPVILGSATPSLESWMQAKRGRYGKLVLASRAVENSRLPSITLVPLKGAMVERGFSATLRSAIQDRLQKGEKSLVFLNRRGYAPVLTCQACGWISGCPRCSVNSVFHKSDGRLHCHHCGWQARVPRLCPQCGNTDLSPLGRGTQRVEEALSEWFPAARISRIDRDSTRRKGTMQSALESVHAGEVDILVGTQMVAKGHDFRDLGLVGVIDADSALFSHSFRAAERLFSNLMQVSGRAGRGDTPGEVLIQTYFPQHPLFAALAAHDFARFAKSQLEERRAAGLPPFSHQAVLRGEAGTLDSAMTFLKLARETGKELLDRDSGSPGGPDSVPVTLYDPVPMTLLRVANVERAQLLLEAQSRRALQDFLAEWLERLRNVKTRVRWHLEVDPLEI